MKIRAAVRKAALCAYALVIITLTHLPPSGLQRIPIRVWDKLAHTAAYLVLAALAAWACGPSPGSSGQTRLLRLRQIGVLALPLLLFAGLDEITQPLVGRACEAGDFAADALGVASALLLVYLIREVRR